ncbi:ATP-dependent 6-phosphofructokinase [Calidifontimicrobium sp. SYSU G02091]|uniref:6-phosphofructokinase n=1 Tax=Calidifontimicrobium sp. SYSU G02091 TaxID=2926421 RepID=UPI001F53A257|nr:ATP-dependent 6-phosphofructokinase [Calidifontimicrobium sp. SYSU G02091]MCI1190722.1 ATP-dependent 6-phosphofructokinase [Calidifontimicrobium sp. SYSU G02091]
MRIGVLTGGGDCPGLNAVIRAVTKSLIHQCGAEVLGIEDGFLGLIEGRARPLDWRAVSGIVATGGTILGTSNRANPLGRDDTLAAALRHAREWKLDAVVAIGGDGTMAIAHGMTLHGLRMVGVPKTIDNDIEGCERSFGFDTAVAIVTEALERVQTTGQSHGRVMIVETMGRYAGWIALEAGIAGAADAILLPEIDYDVEAVAALCREREQRQRYTVICIAEGAKPRGGEMTVERRLDDSPDPIRLGGVAHALRAQLQPHLKSEVRATVLGHVQRGGAPTPFDRVLATQFGNEAAHLVLRGEFDRMVTLVGADLTSVPLERVAGRNRRVPLDHPLLTCARQIGVSLGNG